MSLQAAPLTSRSIANMPGPFPTPASQRVSRLSTLNIMDGPRRPYPDITPGQSSGPAVPPKDAPPVPNKRIGHLEPLLMLNDHIQPVPMRGSDGWARQVYWHGECRARDGRKCDGTVGSARAPQHRINEIRASDKARETKRDTIDVLIEDILPSSEAINIVRNSAASRPLYAKPTRSPRSTSIPPMSTFRNGRLSACSSLGITPYTRPRSPPIAPLRIQRNNTHGKTATSAPQCDKVNDPCAQPRCNNTRSIVVTRINDAEDACKQQRAFAFPGFPQTDKQKDDIHKRRSSACMDMGICSKAKTSIDHVLLHVRPKAREKKKKKRDKTRERKKESVLKKMRELEHDG